MGADDPKIAIVGHSMCLKILSSKEEFWTDVFKAEPVED